MPKMKSHKGLKKRVKITATGKVRYKRANSGHLMSGKSGDRCRRMRRPATLDNSREKMIRILVGR